MQNNYADLIGKTHLCDIGIVGPCIRPCRIVSVRKDSWQYLATVAPLQSTGEHSVWLEISITSRLLSPIESDNGLQLHLI